MFNRTPNLLVQVEEGDDEARVMVRRLAAGSLIEFVQTMEEIPDEHDVQKICVDLRQTEALDSRGRATLRNTMFTLGRHGIEVRVEGLDRFDVGSTDTENAGVA